MKTILAENLRYLRNKTGYTQEELAGKLNYTSASAVQKWEAGVAEPRFGTLRLIAGLFNVSADDLANVDIRRRDSENVLNIPDIAPLPKFRPVPIIGTIACGDPITAEQNIEGYADVPDTIKCDFILRCKGDSMTGARIYDGDLVYIHAQPEVENGQIAAVLIDGEATLKRVYVFADHLILRPENPAYKDLVFDNRNDVRILGLAVAFTGMIK